MKKNSLRISHPVVVLQTFAQLKKIKYTCALGDSTFLLERQGFSADLGRNALAQHSEGYWRDRMKKQEAMGLEYNRHLCFWNAESGKGRF